MAFKKRIINPNYLWWQFKGLVAGCHSFCLFWFFITYIHSFNHNTFIRRHSLKPLSISSSLVCSVGITSLWGRAENRTRACLTAIDDNCLRFYFLFILWYTSSIRRVKGHILNGKSVPHLEHVLWLNKSIHVHFNMYI